MERIVKALYREPVLFAGFIVAVCAALAAAGVIPVWIAPVVAAGGAVITRRFTSPATLEVPGEPVLPPDGRITPEADLGHQRLGE